MSLIVLEGIDASGKGTQTQLLLDHLRGRGLDPLQISFPVYESDSSAPARMYLAGRICPEPDGVNPYAASSFFSVDRYISFRTGWSRDYAAGRPILCNRYTTSNLTHQMEKLPDEERASFADWLCDFEYEKLGLPRPDLVLYLDMREDIAGRLLEKRYSGNNEKKDIHERNPEYLARCRRAGLYAAARRGWQVVRCFDPEGGAPLPPGVIAAEIAGLADRLF